MKVEGAPTDPLWDQMPGVTWTTDRALRITAAMGAGLQTLQMVASELVGQTLFDFRGTTDPNVEAISVHRHALRGPPGTYELELGACVWHVRVAPLRDRGGNIAGTVSVALDITDREGSHVQLARRSLHDTVTGLANRELFVDHLGVALSRLKRREGCVAVLLLDLDRFKLINDCYGQEAGDELLGFFADRLRNLMRPSDTAARFGRDEFALLCEDIHSERDAIVIAQRITEAISRPFSLREEELVVTASIGIALSSGAEEPPGELLHNAHAAMHRAKDKGRARCETFNKSMHAHAKRRRQTENDLAKALEREELEVFYQPELHLDTGKVVAVEALLRWNHPERGFLLPQDFISVAEETRLIVPMGAWVLEQACIQARLWHENHPFLAPLRIAVNLSPCQLAVSGHTKMVERILAETETDPSTICLEITENAVMEDVDSSVAGLLDLKALGVSLAIDDLGTGHSSLAKLKRLPVDVLKVDQSFVQGLGHDPADAAIVSAVVNMAHALDLTAIAEGVETDQQLQELHYLGCDVAQGYYLGAPHPSEAIEELLLSRDPATTLRSA